MVLSVAGLRHKGRELSLQAGGEGQAAVAFSRGPQPTGGDLANKDPRKSLPSATTLFPSTSLWGSLLAKSTRSQGHRNLEVVCTAQPPGVEGRLEEHLEHVGVSGGANVGHQAQYCTVQWTEFTQFWGPLKENHAKISYLGK